MFHYLQRIAKTMRKNHTDHPQAINDLLACVYQCNAEDRSNVEQALKSGTLSSVGTKYSDSEINEMKRSGRFRKRHARFMRKEIFGADAINVGLQAWFDRYKCSTVTPGAAEPGGRRDPNNGLTLFTTETREAVENCKIKSQHIQDPVGLDLYERILPHPNSPHGLIEYLSRRGESNLEAVHNMLANFGNSGMRESLADNLNLTGTARYNLSIRHKLRLTKLAANDPSRKKIPAAWETEISYYNHSQLAHINSLAKDAGVNAIPFPDAEPLCADTGERFFSEYITWMNKEKPRQDENDFCLCKECKSSPVAAIVPAAAAAAAAAAAPAPPPRQEPRGPAVPIGNPNQLQPALTQQQVALLWNTVHRPPPVNWPWYTSVGNMSTGGAVGNSPSSPAFCCPLYEGCCHNGRRGRPPHSVTCHEFGNHGAIRRKRKNNED